MRKTIILVASFLASFSAPAWPQTPLKLGLLLDMSGPYADDGGQGNVTAARMAVEDFGANVLGRPIEIVFADHQNKPDLAASLAWPGDGSTTRTLKRSSMSRPLPPRSP